MRVRALLFEKPTGVFLWVAVPAMLFFSIAPLPAAQQPDAEPPVPKGFGSTEEVKEAIGQGKVRLVNLFIPLPENVEVINNVEYGRVGERSLQLDLYQPKGLVSRSRR
ncbi:MAG TPA: hypothetical protein P5316_07795 [Phycisphaerae bacterium]|nr:hypothetical protein [Phycisphaerae bacterium]